MTNDTFSRTERAVINLLPFQGVGRALHYPGRCPGLTSSALSGRLECARHYPGIALGDLIAVATSCKGKRIIKCKRPAINPHGSYPYNLRIAQVLYLSKYLEGWGTGIRRMMDICREEGVPEPEYKSDGYTVTVTFWKSTQKASQNASQKSDIESQKNDGTIQNTIQKEKDTIQKTIQKDRTTIQKELSITLSERDINLSENQIAILVELYMHPTFTRKNLKEIYNNLSEIGIQYIIGHLQELGLLRREGGRKNGRWVVMLDNNETEKGE